MVSEASRSIRVAPSEMKKPSQLQCCSSCPTTQSLPSAGSRQGPSISTWSHNPVYSIPAYPTALLLLDWRNWLSAHHLKMSEFSSVSLFPCLCWGHVIPCGNFEGRSGKTKDPRTKCMALQLFWEVETQSQVKPSTEDLLYFCMYSFQLLLK